MKSVDEVTRAARDGLLAGYFMIRLGKMSSIAFVGRVLRWFAAIDGSLAFQI